MKINWSHAALIAIGLFLWYLLFRYAGELYFENLELKELTAKQFRQLEQSAAEFKKRTEELERRASQLDKALLGIDKDWSSSNLPDSVRGLLQTLSGNGTTEPAGDIPAADPTTKNIRGH